jgi:ferrochelatase
MNKSPSRAVILMNLGSPDSPETKDTARYLNEFLMDPRVIDLPWLFRSILVRLLIVPFRAPKSAHAYQSIWTDQGSPLITLTKQLAQSLQAEMDEPVLIAMRYGSYKPQEAFDRISAEYPTVNHVTVVPLYPHYAMSSYETAAELAKQQFEKGRYNFSMDIVPPFYAHAAYIDALAESIQPYLAQPFDHILFSYHGIPERHVRKADLTAEHCLTEGCCRRESLAHAQCYRHHCSVTTDLVAKKLQLDPSRYTMCFQSRLGAQKWLQPYTAELLAALPAKGIKDLVIACPAFVSDCLETLEEIAVEGKKIFLEAGGRSYTMVPCVNIHPAWVRALAQLVRETNDA